MSCKEGRRQRFPTGKGALPGNRFILSTFRRKHATVELHDQNSRANLVYPMVFIVFFGRLGIRTRGSIVKIQVLCLSYTLQGEREGALLLRNSPTCVARERQHLF